MKTALLETLESIEGNVEVEAKVGVFCFSTSTLILTLFLQDSPAAQWPPEHRQEKQNANCIPDKIIQSKGPPGENALVDFKKKAITRSKNTDLHEWNGSLWLTVESHTEKQRQEAEHERVHKRI